MEIKVLNTKDVQEYRQLRLLSLQTNPEAFASTYETEIKYPISKFEQRLESNDTKFTLGGFCDNHLVCIATFYRETVMKLSHKGNLVAMYCHKSKRGTGILEKLVSELIKRATMIEGLKVIDLSVLSNNKRAICFYEKLGFEKYATEPNAIYDGACYQDEDMMRLILKN
ncbi:GNAT family N-acetyltransferase [Mammaliicoccus stepanovicii]|uniref:Acetyltransferase n=1 Tax=Mammaliicoccus stepanovicii TaxID=643214 RepID=A0A239ZWC3_9STAP|nr:GNAT family N-acetyltransferase [Mammaliicoccus stepanovicii]PNZ77418.1 GNAT family N-acetyltransferase [Mammaliicoccus stepanovicii]GGI39067.1 GNAT family N-acetyltransferase [Mammaliicoccus stepanovicii]SNV75104.1 acetyltransferase [Mammaliicoccus stepanovicii]